MTREEQIDWLCRLRADLNNGVIFTPWNKEFTEALNDMLEQEPRKGHWMGDSYGYICSNCEHSLNDLAQSMDYISFSKPKYCPNCGADMRSSEV